MEKTIQRLIIVLFCCAFAVSAFAQNELSAGTFFTDGETVTASLLNNLVGNATITTTFYLNQTIQSTPETGGSADANQLLLYNPSGGGSYYRITAANFLFANPNLITALSTKTVPIVGDSVLGYDSVGATLVSMPAANLSGGTNLFNLPSVSGSNLNSSASVIVNQGGTNAITQVSNLVRRIEITHLPLTNTFILSTNLTGIMTFPVSVVPVLVVSNAAGITNYLAYTNGDELAVSTVRDGAQGVLLSYGQNQLTSNAWVSGTFEPGGLDLLVPYRRGTNSEAFLGMGVNHTNFDVTVYITSTPITQ